MVLTANSILLLVLRNILSSWGLCVILLGRLEVYDSDYWIDSTYEGVRDRFYAAFGVMALEIEVLWGVWDCGKYMW